MVGDEGRGGKVQTKRRNWRFVSGTKITRSLVVPLELFSGNFPFVEPESIDIHIISYPYPTIVQETYAWGTWQGR
jgi:hypothetical protein